MQTLFSLLFIGYPNIFVLASREILEINDDVVDGTSDAFWRASMSERK